DSYNPTQSNELPSVSPARLSPTPTGKSLKRDKVRWIHFKQSEFYTLKRLIQAEGSLNPQFAKKEPNRVTARMNFTFTEAETQLLKSNGNMKLYLLSGSISDLDTGEEKYLEFPIPNAITFNRKNVPSYVKGIKGAKGSVKPADLTPYLDFNARNHLDVTYAGTTEDYLLYVYIVQVVPFDTLVENILLRPQIPKQNTLNFVQRQRQDEEDIQTSKEVVSLNCPVSMVRMHDPCKSVDCEHLQCFDAFSFLRLQDQVPLWMCPVCNKKVSYSSLAIDAYFKEVIEQTTEDDETINIDENGKWTIQLEEPETNKDHFPNPASVTRSEPHSSPKEDADIEIISLDSDSDDE
ncbi:hypothetical protein CANARDRAFT_179024, partial [[Candida] arabinofermentans NRRL YB-2248]